MEKKYRNLRLDETDFDILHELLEDSSQPLTNLSRILDLPKSTIHARIKKLEKYEIIDKYTIRLNTDILQYELLAFIMINFDQHETKLEQEEIANKLASLTMVEEVHLIAGEWDILCKVRVGGIDELGDFSTKKLKKIEGIGKSLTFVVLKKIKDSNSKPYIID